MGYLSKIGVYKMKKDADNLLLSAQAATVTLQWLETVSGGEVDDLFKQTVGGTQTTQILEDVKAEKIIVTPVTLNQYEFGAIKVGDVIFRFNRELDLNKKDLVVVHNSVNYYPILFSPEQQELPITIVGDSNLFQTLVCSKVKNRTLE